MSVLLRDRGAISNYFAKVLDGLAEFSDVDAITHHEDTDRFLFQEFKGPHETTTRGQARLLAGLARRDYMTVWSVRKTERAGWIEWRDVAEPADVSEWITVAEYRARFARWWRSEPIRGGYGVWGEPVGGRPVARCAAPLVNEIRWRMR